jgi:hypothetical protein
MCYEYIYLLTGDPVISLRPACVAEPLSIADGTTFLAARGFSVVDELKSLLPASFCSETNEKNPGSAKARIFDGDQPLKMSGTGKSHWPVPFRKHPLDGSFRMKTN